MSEPRHSARHPFREIGLCLFGVRQCNGLGLQAVIDRLPGRGYVRAQRQPATDRAEAIIAYPLIPDACGARLMIEEPFGALLRIEGAIAGDLVVERPVCRGADDSTAGREATTGHVATSPLVHQVRAHPAVQER